MSVILVEKLPESDFKFVTLVEKLPESDFRFVTRVEKLPESDSVSYKHLTLTTTTYV